MQCVYWESRKYRAPRRWDASTERAYNNGCLTKFVRKIGKLNFHTFLVFAHFVHHLLVSAAAENEWKKSDSNAGTTKNFAKSVKTLRFKTVFHAK